MMLLRMSIDNSRVELATLGFCPFGIGSQATTVAISCLEWFRRGISRDVETSNCMSVVIASLRIDKAFCKEGKARERIRPIHRLYRHRLHHRLLCCVFRRRMVCLTTNRNHIKRVTSFSCQGKVDDHICQRYSRPPR